MPWSSAAYTNVASNTGVAGTGFVFCAGKLGSSAQQEPVVTPHDERPDDCTAERTLWSVDTLPKNARSFGSMVLACGAMPRGDCRGAVAVAYDMNVVTSDVL